MTAPAAAQTKPAAVGANAAEVTDAVAEAILTGATIAAILALLGGLGGVASATMKKIFTQRKFGAFVKRAVAEAPAPLVEGATETARDRVERIAGEERAKARAGYLTTATVRLAKAYATGDADVVTKAKAREDELLTAHEDAVTHRAEQTLLLLDEVGDREPDADGALPLGWYLDEGANNCARCIAADGKNFDALKPPPIGWPGHVHPHCFCTAGKPHKNAGSVDDVDPNLRVSNLKYGKGSKLWKYWTGAKGMARYIGKPHPWRALRDALLSEGVPANQANGLATNIMMATPAGRAAFKAGHKDTGRGSEMHETRTAQVVELRGPGTDKPDETPGFTAKLVAYDVPDSYRTSWTRGVFTPALERRTDAGNAIPVVWNHDWADPVGQVVAYRDEPDGFYGDVEFDDFAAVPRAAQAYAQMKPNARTGKATMGQFSFAFERGEEQEDPTHRGVMQQTEVRAIQEFSLVLNGAVPGTGGSTISMRSAEGVMDRVRSGELDTAAALAELRGLEATPTAKFEFRALDGTDTTVDPTAVLASVDKAMADVAAQLDAEDVEQARRYFNQAAQRLSELQFLMGMVPDVAFQSSRFGYYSNEPGELREDDGVLALTRDAEDAEMRTRLAVVRYGRPHTRASTPAKPYGDVKYADPGYQKDKKKRYPLDTKEHVQSALSYIAQKKNAAQYSPEQLAKVKAAINAAAKKFGIGS